MRTVRQLRGVSEERSEERGDRPEDGGQDNGESSDERTDAGVDLRAARGEVSWERIEVESGATDKQMRLWRHRQRRTARETERQRGLA